MSRIGIFSGTFDPVHTGHVTFALQAAKDCYLNAVYFLPEKYPRQKNVVTSYADRIAMLQLALKNHKNIQLGPKLEDTLTVAKTLPKLQQEFTNSKLVFLLGSDVVGTFKYRWDGLKDFLQSVELCIGLRGTDSARDVIKMLDEVNALYDIQVSYCFVAIAKSHVASTAIRQGKYALHDLDSDVAAYIAAHKLYSDE